MTNRVVNAMLCRPCANAIHRRVLTTLPTSFIAGDDRIATCLQRNEIGISNFTTCRPKLASVDCTGGRRICPR